MLSIMHNGVFGLYYVHYELRFVFVLFLIIYVNNLLHWKKDHPPYYSAAINKKPLFLLCVYAL